MSKNDVKINLQVDDVATERIREKVSDALQDPQLIVMAGAKAFRDAAEAFSRAAGETARTLAQFHEVFAPFAERIHSLMVAIRRGQLYGKLRRYIGDGAARWLAVRWPERLLPQFDADYWVEQHADETVRSFIDDANLDPPFRDKWVPQWTPGDRYEPE